jgi:hypothetical protein
MPNPLITLDVRQPETTLPYNSTYTHTRVRAYKATMRKPCLRLSHLSHLHSCWLFGSYPSAMPRGVTEPHPINLHKIFQKGGS